MFFFNDEIVDEYMLWKDANINNFTWWSFINLKADLDVALAFVRFYFPELIVIEGCYILKDSHNINNFNNWKTSCKGVKKDIEKMMNLYEINDFFHINNNGNKTKEKIIALAKSLQFSWTMCFEERYPDNNIIVNIFEEEGRYFITLFEETGDVGT